MKDKDIVCKDTGLIVDDRKNCPFKCQKDLFEEFYVMDKKQCEVTIEDTKSEIEICETCLLTAIDRTNNNVRNNLIDVLTIADANPNILDVCSTEDPTIPFNEIIDAGPGSSNNKELAGEIFESCLLSSNVLDDCNDGETA